MKASLYQDILNSLTCDHRTIDYVLAKYASIGLNSNTIYSIQQQKSIRRTRNVQHKMESTPIKHILNKYKQENQSMLSIAKEIDMPPVMVARHYLKNFENFSKKEMLKVLKDPNQILDLGLRKNVKECLDNDPCFSPEATLKNQQLGEKYEKKLISILENTTETFLNEKQLRKQGYSCTPDILLDAPIYINGNIVVQIDSKASFADHKLFQHDYTNQFNKYVDTYGPGMVIYQFDFVDSIIEPLEGQAECKFYGNNIDDFHHLIPGNGVYITNNWPQKFYNGDNRSCHKSIIDLIPQPRHQLCVDQLNAYKSR